MTAAASITSRKLVWFVVLILGPIFVLLVAAPLLVRTRWFAMGAKEEWVRVLDYPYEVRDVDADVVIVGNSAAMNGVDPCVFERDTGKRIVILPNNIHAVSVMTDKPLVNYLAHNKRPRLIVIYLSPWETGAPSREVWPEGLIMLLRHGTVGEMLHFFLAEPAQALHADISLIKFIYKRVTEGAVVDSNVYPIYETRGFFGMAKGAKALGPGCRLYPEHAVERDAGSLPRQMIERWRSPETNVVLYLGPIPDCEGALPFTHLSLDPAPIAGPTLWPSSRFADDYFQVHVTSEFVPASTRLLENALKEID